MFVVRVFQTGQLSQRAFHADAGWCEFTNSIPRGQVYFKLRVVRAEIANLCKFADPVRARFQVNVAIRA